MYYHTLNEELRRRFGCKVYKLALDGGFTCPNRDGTIGARGCIFCAGDGSGAFAADRALDIPQQIEAAKVRVDGKNGGGKYIAYFQNFTNTYGSLARMEQLFTQALAPEDVAEMEESEVFDLLLERKSISGENSELLRELYRQTLLAVHEEENTPAESAGE